MQSISPTPAAFGHLRRTRRFLALIGALFAAAFLIAAFALWGIAQGLDREQARQSRQTARQALEARAATHRDIALSYAARAELYPQWGGQPETAGAKASDPGQTLWAQQRFDAVLVLADHHPLYTLYQGQPSELSLADLTGLSQADVLAAARQALPLHAAISRYTLLNGAPALLTAAAIPPLSEEGETSTPVLVLIDTLGPDELLELGRQAGLGQMRTTADTAAVPRVDLPGTALKLTWQSPSPGAHLLWTLLPSMLAIAAVLALLLSYCFRFALRALRQIDNNLRSLRKSSDALEASEERFRAVAEATSDWIWETDQRSRVTYLSGRFAAVTGFTGQEWLGHPLEQLLTCDTTPIGPWLATLPETQASLSNLRCSYRDNRGEQRYCRVSARPILIKGQLIGFRGTATDITEEVAAHARIQHLSLHDALTGLPNRHLLARYLDDSLATTQPVLPLTLLVINLRGFKAINDSFGHGAGDSVLLETAHRLRDSTREMDLVARLGGDEFALVLNHLHHLAEIDRFCERLIERLQLPVHYQTQLLEVSACIGIAQGSGEGGDGQELLRCADIALFQARADGTRPWRHYAEQMGEQIQHRRQLEQELRLALRQEEFVLHYQPRYQIEPLHIASVEALVRWNHPVEGLLGPDLFIGLAEQTDLIVPLGRWVLRQACETALHWPESVMVSVNLSPAQFIRSDVVADIHQILLQTGFPASRLELEITENVMLGDIDNALSTLQALKELGVRLNMDDFGTGYSSLGYLRTYPFDSIKIDKRFIATLGHHGSASDRAVVQAIINLARAMGLKVTAEGVETEQQLATLAKDQCNEVQGFYLSRPIDAEALALLLEEQQMAMVSPATATLKRPEA
ncbi:putative bifunctional diguanylate cyclase/phosphodiesterase [Pseudomonas sp. KNUC1026]|uniref:putative bifunctional diguanylate cyclase/phosphodiesterase n=1 Tax=Pseudomonas sp. KNUC1026 TaxID=2893890 RepID=UPI001F3BFF95|nr:GGDEF domain-containing phosphodiesterase [Pseudomonas sp. KNUC1026]UFH50527.1 EAL domain-containing protein [Pseudomonas sp. KNUC1026]